MKILHIVPGLRSGGVAQVVYDLAQSQLSNGDNVNILSIHKFHYNDNADRFTKIGITVKTLLIRNRFDLNIIRELRKYFLDYDIVHVHLFPNQLYCAIVKVVLNKNKRPILITTEHSTWNNRRKYPLLKFLDRWMYNCYDSIVAISPETSNNLSKWLKCKCIIEKITIIYNGIDIKKYQIKRSNKLRKELKIPETTHIVTMVARMSYPKDPLTLVRAIGNLNDVDAVIVGDGPLLNEIYEEAKKYEITNRIHILGLRNDVPQILAGSDIGCLSTKWDGFGLVAVEYMAAGLPVLVTDVEGLRDVVGNKDTLFPYKDYNNLSEKIIRLIENSDYYSKESEFSLSRCQKFNICYMTSSYNSLYKELYNNRKK